MNYKKYILINRLEIFKKRFNCSEKEQGQEEEENEIKKNTSNFLFWIAFSLIIKRYHLIKNLISINRIEHFGKIYAEESRFINDEIVFAFIDKINECSSLMNGYQII